MRVHYCPTAPIHSIIIPRASFFLFLLSFLHLNIYSHMIFQGD